MTGEPARHMERQYAMLGDEIAPIAVSVDGLVKTYNGIPVVDDVSFEIFTGEVFAFLGPNGAGKTTTLEILEGYRQRDAGRVSVLGIDPRHASREFKGRIGVMLQNGGLYPSATASEVLHLFENFYEDPESPDVLLRLVGLEDSAHVRYNQLSGGQQRRLAFAAAIIGKPLLVFLDEPTSGMDPQARRLVWDMIESMKTRGVTVILTTHFMEEAERLADRVAIIDHGRLLALDDPSILTRSSTTNDAIQFIGPPGMDLDILSRLSSAIEAREERPGFYVIETDDAIDLLAEVTLWARGEGILLNDIRTGSESLEDVYLRLTGPEIRE
jgi:ABC-2 type transport system ATP-binding protein